MKTSSTAGDLDLEDNRKFDLIEIQCHFCRFATRSDKKFEDHVNTGRMSIALF